jgi:hypothetical protein
MHRPIWLLLLAALPLGLQVSSARATDVYAELLTAGWGTAVFRPAAAPSGPPSPGSVFGRRIGQLGWHTQYKEAYRAAKAEGKYLFMFFRDERQARAADQFESNVLADPAVQQPLEAVVRVVLDRDALRPFRPPELPDQRLLDHPAFRYMYNTQGIAMIDLTNADSEVYGQVVSAHPFTDGQHYTSFSTGVILGLPRGTVTQRALIYAARIHPAAPVSTTRGQCNGYLCEQARQSSKLMALYGSVGHHQWGNRYAEIARETGRSAQEVAAMSGNPRLIDAAVELVNQWYWSPPHWAIMGAPASIFGYDLVQTPSGHWFGTGLFAH